MRVQMLRRAASAVCSGAVAVGDRCAFRGRQRWYTTAATRSQNAYISLAANEREAFSRKPKNRIRASGM